MGKLHTLRRAIERDPHQWMYRIRVSAYRAMGASFSSKDHWIPLYVPDYRSFVKHILGKLGYDMK